MNGTYIVTGGAGFIGRNVVAGLNARGIEKITIVDRLGKDEKWKNLVGLAYENLVDIDEFRMLCRHDAPLDAAAVIHLGACSSTTETDADYLADNNYRYSRELCEWCVNHRIRFVYASSAATYGDGSRGYNDDVEKLNELHPLNMYGYSKHIFDVWAFKQGLFDRIVGLKYFNVYGPGENHKGEMRSVVHKAYEQIRSSGAVRLFKSYRSDYADGEQVRDFVYVRDAVDVTLHFVNRRDVSGLFNCGTGRARSWNDLAKAVFAAWGREPRIEYIEMPEHLRVKYQYFTQADLTHLQAVGYAQPFVSLEEGVRDYVAYLSGQ
jgi:ADP-L-glycero-D-manno-heptose 6-epimerase